MRYADLKFELAGPNNVTRLLCNAGAETGSGTKTLVFDDDRSAGSIVPVVLLSYYDGTSTVGKWTLKITDTVKNRKTGSLTSFTLGVMPALEAPDGPRDRHARAAAIHTPVTSCSTPGPAWAGSRAFRTMESARG